MTKQYLLTVSLNATHPMDHGRISIDDKGFIEGETPIEDYGMFALSIAPFPKVIVDNIDKFFIALVYIGDDGDLGEISSYPAELISFAVDYSN